MPLVVLFIQWHVHESFLTVQMIDVKVLKVTQIFVYNRDKDSCEDVKRELCKTCFEYNSYIICNDPQLITRGGRVFVAGKT